MERRYGRFYITFDLLEDDPETIMERIMPNFVILKAEAIYTQRYIEYEAYSPLFRELVIWDDLPFYILFFGKDGELNVTEYKEEL